MWTLGLVGSLRSVTARGGVSGAGRGNLGMRTKFASIFAALAAFMAVTAIGATFAGADPLSESSAVGPLPTTTAIPSLQAPACANGLDDDEDGLVDMEDPDCESPEDTTEVPPATAPAEPTESEALPAPAPSPAPGKSAGGVKEGSEIGGGKKGTARNDEIAAPGTRPAAPNTGSPGRCSPRSTKSRPPSAPTSTSPAPAPSAGCSSCPPVGNSSASTPTATARKTPTTRSTRSAPPPTT